MTISLKGSIKTNFQGYSTLLRFYHKAKQHKNDHITIDFSQLKWLDANLCALFNAIDYELEHDNGLLLTTDFDYLKENFDVFTRNGFLIKDHDSTLDGRKSTIPCINFSINNKERFLQYIEEDLLVHRGLANISKRLKYQILADLAEIFSNANFHAATDKPFFICGQLYPQKEVLVLTMVDLGVGFLPAIKKRTNGKIKDHAAAIQWAIAGNTSKIDEPGGLGLQGILEYCYANNGRLQIISGNAYWDSGTKPTEFVVKKLQNEFIGTTINLYFQYF